MALSMEMMSVQEGLGESHIFSYAGGIAPLRLQAPSATYTCAGWGAKMHMFLFEWRGSLLRDFTISFTGDDFKDNDVRTFAVCEGVELDCCVDNRSDGSLMVTVDELRVDRTAYRAEPGLQPWHSTPSCLPC